MANTISYHEDDGNNNHKAYNDDDDDDDEKLKIFMINAGVSGIPCLVVCKKDGTLVTKDGRAGVTSMVLSIIINYADEDDDR